MSSLILVVPPKDLFVSDYVIVGEGVREAAEFFGARVEKSTWGSALIAPEANEEDSGGFWSLRRDARGKKSKKRTLLARTIMHCIKGLSLVGIGSSFQFFVSKSTSGSKNVN